jgi:hypothetical protein
MHVATPKTGFHGWPRVPLWPVGCLVVATGAAWTVIAIGNVLTGSSEPAAVPKAAASPKPAPAAKAAPVQHVTPVKPAPAKPAATLARFVDMSTPAKSLRSYALALHAQQWRAACLHHAGMKGAAMKGCMAAYSKDAAAARKLHLTVTGVHRQGAQALVEFQATTGTKFGIALVRKTGARWLIVGIKPCTGPNSC